MDNAPAVGELQAPAGLNGNADCLLQGKPVAVGLLNDAFHVAAAHEVRDHVGLVLFFSKVEDGDDMRVGTQPSHGLGFPLDASPGGFIKALGLNQGEGYFPVQEGVLGQVDFFLAALSQETFDLIAVVGEGGGLVRDRSRYPLAWVQANSGIRLA